MLLSAIHAGQLLSIFFLGQRVLPLLLSMSVFVVAGSFCELMRTLGRSYPNLFI